jgi:dephospho-CoA kinase
MKIIGLTGGIACGKSTVSKVIVEKFDNVYLVDADVIARSALEIGTEPYKYVIQYFDKIYRDPVTNDKVNILNEDRTINRALLGKLVFENVQVRKMINKATHGFIIKKMLYEIFRTWTIKDNIPFLRRGPERIVVIDAPLLYETYWFTWLCSKIIVVETSYDNELRWLIERNNLSETDAVNRIKSQMPLSKKVDKADYVIRNRSDIETLKQEAERTFQLACKEANTFGVKLFIGSILFIAIMIVMITLIRI